MYVRGGTLTSHDFTTLFKVVPSSFTSHLSMKDPWDDYVYLPSHEWWIFMVNSLSQWTLKKKFELYFPY